MMTTMLQFKVWDIHNKRFLEGYKELSKYFHGFCNDNEHSKDKNYKQCIGLSLWKVPDGYFKICRYTGIKDKTGKKIYAGHILDNHKEVKIGSFYAYLENGLGAGYSVTGVYYKDDDGVCIPVEEGEETVIGHKFQNPELLK